MSDEKYMKRFANVVNELAAFRNRLPDILAIGEEEQNRQYRFGMAPSMKDCVIAIQEYLLTGKRPGDAEKSEVLDTIKKANDEILKNTVRKESKMRILEGHKDGGMDSRLKIEVLDEPSFGGACHQYRISEDTDGESAMAATVINFQKGPVKENGLNGISIEALLEIVKDRLEGFQSGEFKHECNQFALARVITAKEALQERTKDRVKRDVEGKSEQ